MNEYQLVLPAKPWTNYKEDYVVATVYDEQWANIIATQFYLTVKVVTANESQR